jgi:hypothetical protein
MEYARPGATGLRISWLAPRLYEHDDPKRFKAIGISRGDAVLSQEAPADDGLLDL